MEASQDLAIDPKKKKVRKDGDAFNNVTTKQWRVVLGQGNYAGKMSTLLKSREHTLNC